MRAWMGALVAASLAVGMACASAKSSVVQPSPPPPVTEGVGGAGTAGIPEGAEVPEGDPIDHDEPEEANQPQRPPEPPPEPFEGG